jgi:hypothetical protein
MVPAAESRDPEVRASAETARAYLEHFAPTREHADMPAGRGAFRRDRLVQVDPETIESDV